MTSPHRTNQAPRDARPAVPAGGPAARWPRVALAAWLAAAAIAGVAAGGCGARWKGAGALARSGGAAAAFEPVSIGVHPLTRFSIAPDGNALVDVHFELFDRFGHPVKALGEAAVELVARPSASVGGLGGQQVGLWAADLRDPRTNADAYDPVTRTYRLRLSDIPAAAWRDDSITARVRFAPARGGPALLAERAIDVPRTTPR